MAAYTSWTQLTIASSLLLILAIAPLGSAIKCYQCRSQTEPACANDLPTTVPDENHWAHKYIVDCSVNPNTTTLENSVRATAKSDFCRKQFQDIEGQIRIIRSCGFVRGDRACYTTANPPTRTFVCQCDNADLCNSALNVFYSPVLLIMALVVAVRLY